MKEFRLKLHLGTWYLRPEILRDRRRIEIHFLFLTISILKNKR